MDIKGMFGSAVDAASKVATQAKEATEEYGEKAKKAVKDGAQAASEIANEATANAQAKLAKMAAKESKIVVITPEGDILEFDTAEQVKDWAKEQTAAKGSQE